jgi:hypothetical protein
MKKTTKMAILCCTAALSIAVNACKKQEQKVEPTTTATTTSINPKKTRAVGFFVLSKPVGGVSELFFCNHTNTISLVPLTNPVSIPLLNANNPTGIAYSQFFNGAPNVFFLLHKPSATANWRISKSVSWSGNQPITFAPYSNINNSANLSLADLEFDPYYNGVYGAGPRFVMLDRTQAGDARIISIPASTGNYNFVAGNTIKAQLGSGACFNPQSLTVVTLNGSTTSYEIMDVRTPNTITAIPLVFHMNPSNFHPITGVSLAPNPNLTFGNSYSLVYSSYANTNKMFYCGESNSWNVGTTTSVANPWLPLLGGYQVEDLCTQ